MNKKSPDIIVQAQLDAYNSRDLEKFATFYSNKIVVMDFPEKKVIIFGKVELMNFYERIFKNSPKLNCKIVSRIVFDNKVFDHEIITGREEVELIEAVAIYEIESELIQRVYFIK